MTQRESRELDEIRRQLRIAALLKLPPQNVNKAQWDEYIGQRIAINTMTPAELRAARDENR